MLKPRSQGEPALTWPSYNHFIEPILRFAVIPFAPSLARHEIVRRSPVRSSPVRSSRSEQANYEQANYEQGQAVKSEQA